jgi:PAS domain-containing protein
MAQGIAGNLAALSAAARKQESLGMLEQGLNRYWKTVVDTIQDGILIVDQEGTIVSVNKALRDMTGYSASEMIGQTCSILDCTICAIARQKKGDK